MFSVTLSVYVVALAAALLVFLVGLGVWIVVRRVIDKRSYENQIDNIINDQVMDSSKSPGFMYRWNQYWLRRFKSAGIASYADDADRAGMITLIGLFAGTAILYFILNNFLGAFVIAGSCLWVFGSYMMNQQHRRAARVDAQLPGFLAAIKANIQANQTPESAIMRVVDDMPRPLLDDVIVAKSRLQANSTFQEAMTEMGERTSSRDLKFLSSCMIQAVNSGASLEEQITVIQEVLVNRKAITDEINKAVAGNRPTLWASSFAIPAVFIITYVLGDGQSFWFQSLLSWVLFFFIVAAYTIGVFTLNQMVNKLKSL